MVKVNVFIEGPIVIQQKNDDTLPTELFSGYTIIAVLPREYNELLWMA